MTRRTIAYQELPMNVLVLQHIACEPPGVYEEVLLERTARIHRVELDQGEPLPDWRKFDAILAMGGPMSVNDDDQLPWLTDEKRSIGEAVRASVPFFGTCLGVQLLAASLGATVYAGPKPEVGLLPVTLTDAAGDDPVFHGLPRELLTLQWHGDTFDLPHGAVLLASSPAYPHQAFRWGTKAYGVQFHLEISARLVQQWTEVREYAEYLNRVLGPGSAGKLFDRVTHEVDSLRGHGRRLFEQWLNWTCASSISSGCHSR